MMTQNIVKEIVIKNLNLSDRMSELTMSSPLLGAIPELDSMAVVGIITALEDNFGFSVYDDEISADSFESLGSLVAFVEKKLNE
ncbi:MAG: acyl carrier protein [Proteobacteria bacterium]|nr:acyl carrier protein [Pseudomonadota bacterium]